MIVMIYYLMQLMKCLDNLTCCYIDLLWLNSYSSSSSSSSSLLSIRLVLPLAVLLI